jgi:hypothetical protein
MLAVAQSKTVYFALKSAGIDNVYYRTRFGLRAMIVLGGMLNATVWSTSHSKWVRKAPETT